jgi:hypothetical protein
VSSHAITIAGYLVVLAAGIALEVLAFRKPGRVPPLGQVLTWIMRSRTGRIGMLVAWGWIGLHFFAR